ncbi:MAG: thioredoxin family protein [Anaerolineae bacterium]|nr:thioredoxin family protein [Anaerolineae bacterium]MCA9911400.1 thioredoxin family protein [Anaerolineae bacterium]
MIYVKVLGSGCPNCQRLEAETRAALDEAEIAYDLMKITDYADIAAHGVMSTPGLIFNDKIVSAGRIPARAKIIEWALAAEATAL